MNKIKLDDKNIIINSNDEYLLNIENSNYKIDVIKNTDSTLNIINNGYSVELIINLYSNSKLIVNSLNNNASYKVTINLYEKMAEIEYNNSIVSSNDSLCHFTINHLSEKTSSKINNNGINFSNNKLYFQVDGIIPKNIKEVIINQKNRIINIQNGDSKIIPNFIIDSNDIVANHSAYIGNFSLEDIFYIKSRGINEKEMYRLLYRSLLLGNMNLSREKELFNQVLKEWGLL